MLEIDVWSDVACPWCYVGKRRLEAALEAFPHADQVKLTWRAFELDPNAPKTTESEPAPGAAYAERLGKKYGKSTAEAQGMLDSMAKTAKGDGLDLRFDRIRSGNTFDAHRLIHLGHEQGKGDAVKERMFRGYFTEGRATSDPTALAELATDAGLPREDVESVLASDKYADAVRGDEAVARELGIRGVPFFVLDRKIGVSGAQPASVLLQALEQAWAGRADAAAEPAAADGEACGPDGCSV